MIKLILVLLLSTQFSFGFDVIDPVFDEESMEHKNPGCPINSVCSKKAGETRLKFLKLASGLTKATKLKVKKLNQFLKTDGLPIQFLAEKDISEKIDPIMWTSSCKFHNPKNPNNAIMKAEKFLKEIKQVDDLSFTPLRVYLEKSELDFLMPYQSSIIMLDGDRIITLNDYEDLFYQLSISSKGSIKVVNYSSQIVNEALAKKISEVKCPKEMEFDDDFYRKTFCAKLWDHKSKKLKTIQFAWACP